MAIAPSPLQKIQPKPVALAKTKASTSKVEPITAISAVATPLSFDPANEATWPSCAADEFVRADNGQCAKKPSNQPSVAQVASTGGTGSGDCASEIARYNWPQGAAHRVMMQESGNNPGILNDNPATGDYSVGCFQINLYGRNALNRPSEATLKIASENVAYAYKLWSGTSSFWGNWPNTCRKVGC